jgi:ketosteroid isomerase-like protein
VLPAAGPARERAGGDPGGETFAQHRMRSLVQGYARAKCRADAAGALAFCHEDFVLETVPFGIASRDRNETAAHLDLFFHAFPDYGVVLEDLAYGAESVGCWGEARMTMRGDILGLRATGATARVPVACAFTFRDGLLARERFYFDLATLCDGIRVPVEELRAALATVRGAAADAA